MPNTITNRQLFYIVFLTLTSVAVVSIANVMSRSAGTGSWVTLSITTVIFSIGIFFITSLGNMHPGKSLAEYSRDLVGKAGSAFLCVFYAQYFITLLTGLLLTTYGMLQANFFPNTPMWATLLATIPVIGFTAYKGITNVARLFEIYGVIFILINIAIQILMFYQGDISEVLPLWVPSEAGSYLTAVKDTIASFLGIEVLLIVPFTKQNGKKAVKTALISVLLTGVFYIIVVYSSIMMLGFNESKYFQYSLITSIRLVELPMIKVFARIDLLYLTVGFLGFIAGISMAYLSAVECLCRLLPKLKRIAVVIAVGAIVLAACLLLSGIQGIDQKIHNVLTCTGISAALAVPLILFVIAKVKHHGKTKAG